MYETSCKQAADIYTKGFVNPEDWSKCLRNINIFDPSAGLGKQIHAKILALQELNKAPEVFAGDTEPVPTLHTLDEDTADHGTPVPVMLPAKSKSQSYKDKVNPSNVGVATDTEPCGVSKQIPGGKKNNNSKPSFASRANAKHRATEKRKRSTSAPVVSTRGDTPTTKTARNSNQDTSLDAYSYCA